MPDQTIKLFKKFKKLKQKRDHIPNDQYITELKKLRTKVLLLFEDPELTPKELQQLIALLSG